MERMFNRVFVFGVGFCGEKWGKWRGMGCGVWRCKEGVGVDYFVNNYII